MSSATPSFQPVTECPGCGAWSAGPTCARCAWVLEGTRPSQQPLVRVLVDALVDTDASLLVVRAWCARLPWLEGERLGADAIGPEGRCPCPTDAEAWAFLRQEIDQSVREHVRRDLARLEIGGLSAAIPLAVTVRLHNHCVGLDLSALDDAGTRVVPFDATASANALALRDEEVAWDIGAPDLRLRSGVEPPRVGVRFPAAVTVERVGLRDASGRLRGEVAVHADARPDTEVSIPLPALPARDLHELRAATSPWTFAVRLRGRPQSLTADLGGDAVSTLPAPESRVDLYLHPGVASFRLALVPSLGASPTTERWSWSPTAELQRSLDLPPFDKAGCLAESAILGAWIAGVTPQLAAWVQRTYGAWLDRLVVATPSSVHVTTEATAHPAVLAAAAAALLSGVTLVPEYLALYAHYREPLRAISAMLVEHRKAHTVVAKARDAKIAWWEEQKRKQQSPLLGAFLSDPGPRPEPPPAFAPLEFVPSEFATELEAFAKEERLLLVDAGASGVDVAGFRGAASSSRRSGWDNDALATSLRGALLDLGAGSFITVLSGGGWSDPARRALIQHAMACVGIPEGNGRMDSAGLTAMAVAMRASGRSIPALDRVLYVQEKGGEGDSGRFDVVDGLRP